MRYCNAFVFLPDKGFVRGGFDVEDGLSPTATRRACAAWPRIWPGAA